MTMMIASLQCLHTPSRLSHERTKSGNKMFCKFKACLMMCLVCRVFFTVYRHACWGKIIGRYLDQALLQVTRIS